jgi:hypothetical protein
MPGGVVSKNASSGATPTGTIANQPSGVPLLASTSSRTQNSSLYYLPTQIPAIPQMAVNKSTAGSQENFLGVDFLIAATAAFAAIALVVVFVAVRHHTNRPPTPPR